jgi:hypothetical protein
MRSHNSPLGDWLTTAMFGDRLGVGLATLSTLAVGAVAAASAWSVVSPPAAVLVACAALMAARLLGEFVVLPRRLAPSVQELIQVKETLSWVNTFTVEPTWDPMTTFLSPLIDLTGDGLPDPVEEWLPELFATLTVETLITGEVVNGSSAIRAGLCQCGCGGETKPYSRTDLARGQVKGNPRRFLQGHNLRPVKA